MKIIRFQANKKTAYGVLTGNSVKVISGKPYGKFKFTGEIIPFQGIKLLAPCQPSKIVALGLNYVSHAQELQSDLPKNPLIFIKPPTTVIGPEDKIIYPASSHQVDYEAELGVVIGKTAHYVKQADALKYVLGYICVNDVTARDQQRDDVQWTRSKSYDTFAPIGPWIETELDSSNTDVQSYLNGEPKQQGNTRDLIFGIPVLISFISNILTLLPGDIISTGTTGGIGPMQPGDTIEIKIPAIGTLRNQVISL